MLQIITQVFYCNLCGKLLLKKKKTSDNHQSFYIIPLAWARNKNCKHGNRKNEE